MGADNPTIYITLPLYLSLASIIFQVIYINAFKQGVDLPYSFCQDKLRKSILFEYGLVGEVQQNTGTAFIFHFPVSVCLVSMTKSEKSTIPTRKRILVVISYQIILILVESILLGGFELGEEFLDVFGKEENIFRMKI